MRSAAAAPSGAMISENNVTAPASIRFGAKCGSMRDPAWAAPTLSVRDTVTQGAMVRGQTTAGATVTMNGQSLPVTPEGAFVFAVARAYEGTVTVRATDPQGQTAALELPVVERSFDVQRIDGLP